MVVIYKTYRAGNCNEDAEERNKAAKYIIQVMGSLNPHLRDVLDFQHYGINFFMSDFKLDVDSPYLYHHVKFYS
jgi:hypothetical protein